MDLIRKHLLAEGTIAKECLVQILHTVTALFSKWHFDLVLRKWAQFGQD